LCAGPDRGEIETRIGARGRRKAAAPGISNSADKSRGELSNIRVPRVNDNEAAAMKQTKRRKRRRYATNHSPIALVILEAS
jgi:hypothetical protein